MTGSAIINESMLTGESIPVFKSELPYIDNKQYDPDEDTKYTLFSGTEVIQCRKTSKEEVTALAIRTSYGTAKGSLIKSILYPKPCRLNFYADSMKFLGIMACIALIGFAFNIGRFIEELSVSETIDRSFNMLSTAVPPALPAVMGMGITFALARLRKYKIYCISPKRINLAGRIRTIVFDKTGTLTEEGLNLAGLRSMKTLNEFYPLVEGTEQLFPNDNPWWESYDNYQKVKNIYRLKLLECMASCH